MPNISIFYNITTLGKVCPDTDISLLQSRRELFYVTKKRALFEYNVDTRENRKVAMENKALRISYMTGVYCGAKTIFQDNDIVYTYTLNWRNKITLLHEVRKERRLTSIFISSMYPKDLSKEIFEYDNWFNKKD